MYQPGMGGHRMWRRSNVEVAGIMIAGNCVFCIVFFGFGLLLIGTFSMATSTAFDPKPSDPPFFRNSTNVPRLIGKIFLSLGAIIFVIGLVLLFKIIRKAKDQARNNQGETGTNVVLGGTTYPGANYAATQPYSNTYPTQPNAQFQQYNVGQAYPPPPGQGQSYQPVISGQGQVYQPEIGKPYPPAAGQGQQYPQGPGLQYPPVAGHGEPFPQGPGQQYPPVAGHGQPYPQGPGQQYPPVAGQGAGQGQPYPQGPVQPYPQGPGQPYPPTAGHGQPYPSTGSAYPHPVGEQPYPSAGGNPEKSTNVTNLPYNPGHPYQTPPSGYPGSGHPQPDAPPPYSNY